MAVMKCVLAKSFGAARDVLYMSSNHTQPVLEAGSGKMLVRVHAMSLSPGDWRTLSGSVDVVRKPPFPYIPGHDICGIVEAVDGAAAQKFKPGDCVVATWDFMALGGLAEYIVVDPSRAALKPAVLTSVEGAALANSAIHALLAVEAASVKSGDRVLVLGGGGGFGTALVQLLRGAGASFIAATSTQEPLLKSLGADQVVDHTAQAWWELSEFKEKPFDIIFDCAEGAQAWKRATASKVLKSGWRGGRFVGVTMPNPAAEIHSYWALLSFGLGTMMAKPLWTRLAAAFVPRFVPFIGTCTGELLEKVLKMAADGKLKAVMDPGSPFPFTEDGVKAAFALQESTHVPGAKHAHGKIVVLIDPSSSLPIAAEE